MPEAGTQVAEGRRETRYGRLTLVLAAVLTVAMLGWQGWHIYDSYRSVAHKESGKCATKLVEEVYFAAEMHGDLIEDLEHGAMVGTPIASTTGVAGWRARFDASAADLRTSIDGACDEIKGDLLAAVGRVGDAQTTFDAEADLVGDVLDEGRRAEAAALIAGPAYVAAQEEYSIAVDTLVSETRKHLEVQLGAERRNELLSVSVAVAIFALALGAWGLFLGRIRRGQLKLAAEERQREQAEAELLQAQKMDALGTMAGEIAHDFNNLVTAIWGSATSARAQLEDDHPALASLQRVEEASAQANEVVSGLLAFGRRTVVSRDPVELGALIWETSALLQSMMPDSIELVIETARGGSRWVLGDRTQLQQVLINVAINARDSMPSGGRLLIRARCNTPPGVDDIADARTCLEVVDTGIGMTPEVQARIFEPFFTTRAKDGRGTGLGLAIVHGIVTDHGGTIHVDSTPGEGTRFLITLPMIEAPDTAQVGALESDYAGSGGGTAVLLTEDHRHVREIMAETLVDAGYAVHQASTGDELLTQLECDPDRFGLFIIDLDIPGPNGLECLHRIRAAGVTTPILMVTGTAAGGLEDEVGAGARVLRKPFAMGTLLDVSAELLNGAAAGVHHG